MGDSDEEYERRRRDKFRRERNDYTERREERRGRTDQWEDRGSRDGWGGSRNRERNRESYRDYDRNRHDRYSPQRHDLSPPQMKRMRRDWDDNGMGGYGHYDMPYSGSGPMRGGGAWGHGHDMPPPQQGHYHGGMSTQRGRSDPDYPTQPPMMPFKMFLAQQDDNITDEESIRKYNEYKLEFKRTQINEFFLAHKDEEWFKSKYHPEECGKRNDEARKALKKRAEVFSKLFNIGKVEQVSVDLDKSTEMVKLLDAAVILMEGGSDFDLKALDIPDPPPDTGKRSRQNSESQHERRDSDRREGDRREGERRDSERRDSERSNSERSKREREDRPDRRGAEEGASRDANDRKNRKRRREEDKVEEDASKPPQQSEGVEVKNENEQSKAVETKNPSGGPEAGGATGAEDDFEGGGNEDDDDDESSSSGEDGSASESDEKEKGKRPRDYSYESGSESETGSSSGSESDGGGPDSPAPMDEDKADPKPLDPSHQVDGTADDDDEKHDEEKGAEATEQGDKKDSEKEEGEEEDDGEEKDVDTAEPEEGEEEPQPKALHKTCSIFLRNLAPTITKQEVEAMCKRYPGFLRVALQDPQPERRFHRRGWVTFDRTVNIVDICWNLNNIRLRDCEMGAIVNRDLKQRVRPVNGITSHKQVVKSDIKHAACITQALDSKWKIWEDDDDEKKDKSKEEMSFGLVSKNPVLKNITDYLVEEGSFEEEELLGQTEEDKPKEANSEVSIEREEELIKVLDRMILYLRIVHSFDFYSAVEYPNEDEMPHRCGIMHARGPPPPNRLSQNDVNDWISQFESKVKPFAKMEAELSEAEAKNLGKKDVAAEVEKFVTANTQELAKDKWLCPLSGKKFKGPEFVRKHVFNKHGEKVEEVKKEVVFFNNYLMDPRRPHLPEHPGNKQSGSAGGPSSRGDSHHSSQGGASYHMQQQAMGGGGAYGGPGNMGGNSSSNMGGYGGKRGSGNRGGYYNNRNDNYRNDRPRDRFANRRDRRSDPRSIIEYRDLDAPDDMDIF